MIGEGIALSRKVLSGSRRGRAALIAATALAAGSRAMALTTINYGTSGATYSQYFNGLQNSGTAPTETTKGPFDLSTTFEGTVPSGQNDLTGWEGQAQAAGTAAGLVLRIDSGTLTTGALYSYGLTTGAADQSGTSGSSNRALGSLASAATIAEFGAVFTNNTGLTLNQINISYTGEEFRDGGQGTGAAGNLNTLAFSYNVGAGSIDPSGTTFTTASGLSYTDNTHTSISGGQALDGTNSLYQSNVSGTISNLTWAPGTTIVIRWQDTNDAGNDDGISIDNFNFAASQAYLSKNITWNVGNGTWNTASSNFTTIDSTHGTLAFTTTDNTSFIGTQTSTVNITSGGVLPNVTNIKNTGAYTFLDADGTNGIGGTGALNKYNSGALTLSSPNSYTGGTTLNGGSVNVSNANQLGSGGITSAGGNIAFNGTSGGTAFSIASLTTGAGASTIAVAQPISGVTAGSTLTFTSASALTRGATDGAIIFTSTGQGTLGNGTAVDPAIKFTTAPPLGPAGAGQGIISSSTTTAIPYALIGSTAGGITSGTFASYDTTKGVIPATLTNRDETTINAVGNTSSTTENTNYVPLNNGSLTGSISTQTLTINPQASGLSLDLVGNAINTTGIVLSGGTDFSIANSANFANASLFGIVTGTGKDGNGTHTLWVTNPTTTLFVATPIGCSNSGAAGASPFTFAGPGFLNLNGTSGDEFNSTSTTTPVNINLIGGTLQATIPAVGATNTNATFQAPDAVLNLRGGVFEVVGGGTFTRPLSGAAGGLTWAIAGNSSVGAGSGGFSANGGVLNVNLGGAATPDQLIWGATSTTADAAGNIPAAFVQDGYALLFGSSKSNNTVNWQNPIGLDAGSGLGTGPYTAREIDVIQGTGVAADQTQITGVISGSSSTDLIKTGTGVLALSGSNTYAGKTFVQTGTLVAGVSNSGTLTGAFGPSANVVTLGPSSGIGSASLLTGGAFTVANPITVAAGSSGTLTVGGSTDNNSSFSGTITLNNNVTFSQIASAGTNSLSITGGIVGGTSGAESATFSGPGNISVNTSSISDNGTNTIALAVTGGTVTLAAANGYSGATTITGGTLDVTGAIASSGTISVNPINAPATLILDGTNATSATAAITSFAGPSIPIITVNSSQTIGSITSVGTTSFTSGTSTVGIIAGTGTLNVSSGVTLNVSTAFTQGPVSSSGSLNVNGGTTDAVGTVDGAGSLTLANSSSLTATHIRQTNLNIGSGSKVTITDSVTGPGNTASTSILTDLTNAGTLNLQNNDLIVKDSTQFTAVQAAITNAYHGGAWNQAGITSSSAAARANAYGLGYSTPAATGTTTFDGQTGLASGTVLVKYTLLGDTKLIGTVGLGDYNTVLANLNTGTLWSQGAFHPGTATGLGDYNAVLANFNVTASGSVAAPSVKSAAIKAASITLSPAVTSNAATDMKLEVNTVTGDVFAVATIAVALTGYDIFDSSNNLKDSGDPNTDLNELLLSQPTTNRGNTTTFRNATNYKLWTTILDNASTLAEGENNGKLKQGTASTYDTINVPSGGTIDFGHVYATATNKQDLTFSFSEADPTNAGNPVTGTTYGGEVDYVSTNSIPEPGMLGLLSIGGVMMTRRRQRGSAKASPRNS